MLACIVHMAGVFDLSPLAFSVNIRGIYHLSRSDETHVFVWSVEAIENGCGNDSPNRIFDFPFLQILIIK